MANLSILILTSSCYYFEVLAMFSVADKTAFRILSKTWVVFRPTSDCMHTNLCLFRPPAKHMIVLYWCTSYPLYCSFSSHLNGPYFIVFPRSSSLDYWSMGNSFLWSWLSWSHDSQTSYRPVLGIGQELWHPKMPRKISGRLRNGPQEGLGKQTIRIERETQW